jgi:hypothetical protein
MGGKMPHLVERFVGDALDRRGHISVAQQRGWDACAAVLVELALLVEDDECNLAVAENGELVGLLDQTIASLLEGDLANAMSSKATIRRNAQRADADP